jgi:hypothetical protein
MSASRSSRDLYRIASYGDLEVMTLHEMQAAYADIANSNLYKVLGEAPNQQILFHNDACFDLFLIRASELFAEGGNNGAVEGANLNFSLFSAVQRLCNEHAAESRAVGLDVACQNLADWLDHASPFEFWCPDLNILFMLQLTRRDLLSFAGNLSKHNLLRLNSLLGKLQRLCERNGYTITDQDLVGVLDPFLQELRSRLIYHATRLAEILICCFAALNELVVKRFEEQNTNDVRRMKHPEGVSSDSFKNLYGSTLVFRRFARQRFDEVTPVTTEFLKLRY